MPTFPEGSPEPLAGLAVEHFRIEGPVTSAQRAWRLVGDTDWMNRAGGNGRVLSMGIRDQPDGFPMLAGELAGPFGLKLPFQEVCQSWVTERFFRQVRDIESPLVTRTDYRAELIPVPGGVRPVVEMSLTGPGWGAMMRRGLSLSSMEKKWSASLQRLANTEETEDGTTRQLGAEANAALARWRDRGASDVLDHLERHFRTARPGDLAQMRAFVLADRWGISREALLETLLEGVEIGAADLFWSVRCTRCYGQVAGGRLLSDLADHADCPACRLRSNTDLGENVEVLFAPHPSVVTHLEMNYCTMFPAMAPAQRAVLTLAPGQRVQTSAPVPPGNWRLGPGLGLPDVNVASGAQGSDHLNWSRQSQGDVAVRAGEIVLDVVNDGAQRSRVYLTQVGGALPMVPASLLTTKDSFRRRLGHQVLAADLRVGVRSVALLFTDLSGSTAMYESLGDAQAFAVVRDHFVLLRKVAAAHGGTVVKTIGDAVMAAFFDAHSAMAAAIAMQREFAAWASALQMEHPPGLKVGIHVGPALVVHTDQSGLDYFGGTVNLAARTQGAAESGEVIWTAAVHAQERVVRMLADEGIEAVPVAKELKGLGSVGLWRASPR